MTSPSPRPIFALDIGTRSVVGLILEKKKESYHVLDVFSAEHSERSMLDGQIHNVPAVSDTISYVKTHLENIYGPLKTVCVAAAGRSLKTQRAKVDLDITGKPIFDRQSLLHLELSAVQKAQFQLASEQIQPGQKVNDYCVGYSVIQYSLDGEPIGSLLDQRGETASVEVIATFLPKIVVESLISALQRSDLELEALTLEPIAAINVLIPQSMRRLNVALVDIGAGTSDIAITDLGTVTAYGMVPNAGDEITEALSDHFLLDFPDAEKIKRELSVSEKVTITDILGMEASYTKEEVVSPVQDAIDYLADQITLEIFKLNGRSPQAVMLVGGGSMTPGLSGKLAQRLELPENRVAIRGIDAIKSLTFEHEYEATPELVTPVGIAIAAKESPVEYISIQVNDETVRLFDIKKLTVGDGLLSSGLELSKLHGKPGMAMMVKVNGRVVSVPGSHGTPPVLKKNGDLTELDAPLIHGDRLEVIKGTNGKDASATIKDLMDVPESLTIIFNGETRQIPAAVYLNGEVVEPEAGLKDRDTVESYIPKTAEELLPFLSIEPLSPEQADVQIVINQKPFTVRHKSVQLVLNGKDASLDAHVSNGDKLDLHENDKDSLILKNVLNTFYEEPSREIVVTFNEEPVRLEKELLECYVNDTRAALEMPVRNGDRIKTVKQENVSFIFQDVFSKVKIHRPENQRKKPVILRNEEETSFSSDIHHGDNLALKWVDMG